MKVVLFCGGLGMRLRDYAENVPKPLVKIGRRPILWHLMKYYSHFGHNEFILCLGYKGEFIKHFFLNYEESVSNDFVLSEGGERVELLSKDIQDWKITFADTGRTTSIGERLVRAREYLDDDEVFLANYADGLTDLHLPDMIDHFSSRDAVGSFLCVKPHLSYHSIERDADGIVTEIRPFRDTDMRVNGGFMVLRREIFDYMEKGDDLVEPTFHRLVEERELLAYDYDGFWQAVDTAKDKARVDRLHATGRPPWAVWDGDAPAEPRERDLRDAIGGTPEDEDAAATGRRDPLAPGPGVPPEERSAVTPVSERVYGDGD